MAIVRIFTGADQQSHFEDVEVRLEPRGDRSETGELLPGSGILVRRFEAGRSNPWHHAPGRYAVFTLCGAVDITIGDGSVRRIGSGDVHQVAAGIVEHGRDDRTRVGWLLMSMRVSWRAS